MLDIQFIREHTDLVKRAAQHKNIDVDIDRLVQLDARRRELLQSVEELRQRRNEHAENLQAGAPTDEQIKTGKELKEKLNRLEAELESVQSDYLDYLMAVPNIIPDDTPLGGEDANRQEKTWGDVGDKPYAVVDHLSWGEQRGLIDFERGAKVAGAKFYFLKGSLAELDLAVQQFVQQRAVQHGFTPLLVPHMVTSRIAAGTGYLPRGQERQIYKIEGEDLNLIATAEMPITGYHADEILSAADLPLCYVGTSPSYRMEAGAYGKHSRGLYRVHQFNKLELYVFCRPADSETWHQKLLAFEEDLCQALEIPYEVIRIAAGDLGAPAFKKYDVQYWSPVDKAYRELMSVSNVTDYQARRLNIRFRDESGVVGYVHTLNGTAAALSRIPIALIENHQTADGNVVVPAVLKPYLGGREQL